MTKTVENCTQIHQKKEEITIDAHKENSFSRNYFNARRTAPHIKIKWHFLVRFSTFRDFIRVFTCVLQFSIQYGSMQIYRLKTQRR